MDTAFLLDDTSRANFLRLIMQSFGCTYICLWLYLPHPSNCLVFKDGNFHEENSQPSSSSGSLARRLFDQYRQSMISVENDLVPGLAFKNSLPYLEIKELDLQRLASNDIQQRFYREAKIKTVAFMGCKSGEIEIGMSSANQINMEMEMKNWFPEDFSRQSPLSELPQPTDQNRPSSSSSSLRSLSLSMESSEYSPLLFNIPSSSYLPETLIEPPIEQALRTISTTAAPHQQVMQMQPLNRIPNLQFLTQNEEAAMTRAILAVISSPSSSSSTHHQPQQNLPHNYRVNQEASAFRNYNSALAPTGQFKANQCKQSMLRRAVTYFNSLNLKRSREQMQGSRPTGTQLHHMISERKRREKLNESFQALRSLLPPGSKRDKASVLISTREYLSSLKAQVSELSRRNELLEAQLPLPPKEATTEEISTEGSSNGRPDVRITQISESTEERIIELRVNVRSDGSMLDLMIRILEFLKHVKNASLISADAETQMAESSSMNRVVLRLKIEGTEWDESAFREAVRRVVADLAQ